MRTDRQTDGRTESATRTPSLLDFCDHRLAPLRYTPQNEVSCHFTRYASDKYLWARIAGFSLHFKDFWICCARAHRSKFSLTSSPLTLNRILATPLVHTVTLFKVHYIYTFCNFPYLLLNKNYKLTRYTYIHMYTVIKATWVCVFMYLHIHTKIVPCTKWRTVFEKCIFQKLIQWEQSLLCVCS